VNKLKGVEYKLRLQGLSTPEGTIPLSALLEISKALIESSQSALRLLVEGVSTKRGRTSNNLKKPLDFAITGIGKGSTTLKIQAPTIEQSVPELVQQLGLWDVLINPEDTVFSLLSKSVKDATSRKLDSDYYDRGVLEKLAGFKAPLKEYVKNIEMNCPTRPDENFKITDSIINEISYIETETPEPQTVVVTGIFNSIKHTPKRFGLELGDGHQIRGEADSDYINTEEMRNLWGKKVTVKGLAYYKATGFVRFIEAEMIKPFEAGEELFETISMPRISSDMIFKKKQPFKNPLSEVWGKWPGDESIDEILQILEQTSREEA
jgi:hypothetical protein